jgi:hypothetical protein
MRRLSAPAIHASFLFTAAAGVGIPRYTLSMWPAMVTSLIFCVVRRHASPESCRLSAPAWPVASHHLFTSTGSGGGLPSGMPTRPAINTDDTIT